MTDTTGSADSQPHGGAGTEEQTTGATTEPQVEGPAEDDSTGSKRRSGLGQSLRQLAIVLAFALVIDSLIVTFVARPYRIPSGSMEPTLQIGDYIVVDKLSYRFDPPKPGDVVVFKAPPSWSLGYQSIRSHNTAVRRAQDGLSFFGLWPADEDDLVKRVIAVGGQTVQCRVATGLTVNGKPLSQPFLDAATMRVDPVADPCAGPGLGLVTEFGPVTVPQGRLWVMGDNRTNSADSRVHCASLPDDLQRHIPCTGDPMAGTVPVDNVIGKARFIALPPSRWGVVRSVDVQPGGTG